jgi:hypothetical protein
MISIWRAICRSPSATCRSASSKFYHTLTGVTEPSSTIEQPARLRSPASLLRVTSVVLCNRRLPVNLRYALLPTEIARWCNMFDSRRRRSSGRHPKLFTVTDLNQDSEKSFASSEHAPMEPVATIPMSMKCWREGVCPSATAKQENAIADPLAAIKGALATMGRNRAKLASINRDGQETKKPKTNAKKAPSAGSRSAAETPLSIITQTREPSTPKSGPKTR